MSHPQLLTIVIATGRARPRAATIDLEDVRSVEELNPEVENDGACCEIHMGARLDPFRSVTPYHEVREAWFQVFSMKEVSGVHEA